MNRRSIVAVLIVMGAVATAQQARAQCVSTNENACPASSSTSHKLRFNIIGSSRVVVSGFRATVGSIDFAGLDVAGACISEDNGATWSAWTILDEETGSIVVSLNDDSFICALPGNEQVTMVSAPMSTPCGTMTPLSTGGHTLNFVMAGGNDVVNGPTSNYLLVCGGSGNDQITNARSARGGSGNDLMTNARGGIYYGGSGNDRLICGGFGAQCRGENGSDCVQQSTTTGPPSTDIINCGSDCDVTSHSSGTLFCDSDAPVNCSTVALPVSCP